MRYLLRKILFFLIILIPFWSFLVWFFWPKTPVNGMIIDKTVLTKEGNEHRSLNWVLSHEKITKPDGSQYDISEDYYGFFPVNRPEYSVKDFSVFDRQDIDSLGKTLDFLYYTDAYGIYENEWVYDQSVNERTPIVYGGMTDREYDLVANMYRNRKLVFNEFNDLLSPTPLDVRFRMSRINQIDLTGWTGRYYHSLDTLTNSDIPRWMRRLHRQYLDRPFDYPDIPGIVLIHETDKILVLRSDSDLEHEIPIMNITKKAQERYGVTSHLRYPYWFEVNASLNPDNTYATYKIHTTKRGDSILGQYKIPTEFPAMVIDDEEHLHYYFCGDFSDNPIPFGLAYFSGIQYIDALFYNNRDFLDRRKFFWEMYLPLVKTALFDYLEKKDDLEPGRRLPPAYSDYVSYYAKMGWRYPDIGAIAKGEGYRPDKIYGEQYRSRAYRDSVLKAARKARLAPKNKENENEADTTERYRVRAYNQQTDTIAQQEDTTAEKTTGDTLSKFFNYERFLVGGRSARQDSGDTSKAAPASAEKYSRQKSQTVATKKSEKREPEPVVSGKMHQASKGEYHIIVASLSKKVEAEKLLERLEDTEAFIVYTAGVNRYRISRGVFNSREKAQKALPQIAQQYSGAWIASY